MDVVIKSFNRAYYLERCIRSIQQNLSGNHNIVILDDGTPDLYLQRIRDLFPEVKIKKSDFHGLKSQAIADHLAGRKKYDLKSIPSQFWVNSIKGVSDVFLLMEDDAWFTKPLDVDSMMKIISDHNIATLKLFWCGNDIIVKGKKESLHPEVEKVTPELPLENPMIFSWLMSDRLRLRTMLRRSGLVSGKFLLPYYGLYTVSSAFFRKDYWLRVWENSSDKINEPQQLANALQWKSENPETSYAKTVEEKVKTTYAVSSINHLRTVDFDFIAFNHRMNEAWCKGLLDATQNLPGDFHVSYLQKFLPQVAVQDPEFSQWKKWIEAFRQQFRDQGCKIDPG